jgi:hypothetical protein
VDPIMAQLNEMDLSAPKPPPKPVALQEITASTVSSTKKPAIITYTTAEKVVPVLKFLVRQIVAVSVC